MDYRRRARDPSQGISKSNFFGADTGSHNGPLALGTAYELVRVSFGACSANFFSAQTTDPLTFDRAQFDGHAHENDNERRDFHGCIPAFDVVGGISFGDTDFLRVLERLLEAQALLHAGENHISCGIENPAKAAQVEYGKSVEERKNGSAIHHGRFEEEAAVFGCGEGTEFLVSVDHGAFVRCDSVRAHFQRSVDVIDGGFAGGDV